MKPRSLTIIASYRCNAECRECCFESNPRLTQRLSLDEIKQAIEEAVESFPSIKIAVFTGGEVFLLKDDLYEAIFFANQCGLLTRCVTNGFWGKTEAIARRTVSKLVDAGLTEINIRGKLAMLNTAASEITLQGGEKIEYDVANIIPRQSAGKVLAQSGLVDDSGWCPVDGLTMESSRLKSLYVIGDCAAVGDMPKSAFSAIGQAHHCALNLLMQITGQPLVSPKLMNVCYSLVAANAGISISHRFRYDSPRRRIALENVELSPLMASRDELYWECQQSENWFRLVTEQAFGSHLYEFS